MNGDFSEDTKRAISKRAGERCSICGIGTSAPAKESDRFVNLGEAAHIRGNKETAHNRFDLNMTDEQRSHIENAIWLCRVCHKKIDTDDQKYSVATLVQLKAEHEKKIEEGFYNKQYPSFELQQSIEHDKTIFVNSELIFSESMLNKLLDQLQKYRFVYYDDDSHTRFNQFIEFHNQIGNRFLIEELNSLYEAFLQASDNLLLIIYSVPEDDKDLSLMSLVKFGQPHFVGMQKPEFNFGHFTSSLNYIGKYYLYERRLDSAIKRMKTAYRNYREAVARHLFI
jgi:hypothetical protein